MISGPEKFVLALPSKGRLQEQAINFLSGCGFDVLRVGNGREYASKLLGIDDVNIAYFRPDEIPVRVEQGDAHAGITGEDLFRESGGGGASFLLMPTLGFGRARLVTAVPQSWVDVTTIADLEEAALIFRQRHGKNLRVATKFLRLTRAFFAEQGIVEYSLVESLGATEGSPSAGIADFIVDLTSTGTTLVENHLKEIAGGTVLHTEACLVASLRHALWNDRTIGALQQLVEQIEARSRAMSTLILRFSMSAGAVHGLAHHLAQRYQCVLNSWRSSGDGSAFEAAGREFVVALCPRKNLYAIVKYLKSLGATDLIVDRSEFVFDAATPTFEKFSQVLKRRDTEADSHAYADG